MRERHPDFVLTGLIEKTSYPIIKVVSRFIDVDEARTPLVRGDRRPSHGGLGNEGDEKAPENRSTLVLQQILGRVDEEDLAFLQG